jgi:hypothetical protein
MQTRTCLRCGRSFRTSIPGPDAICLECLRTFMFGREQKSAVGFDDTPTQPTIALPIRDFSNR